MQGDTYVYHLILMMINEHARRRISYTILCMLDRDLPEEHAICYLYHLSPMRNSEHHEYLIGGHTILVYRTWERCIYRIYHPDHARRYVCVPSHPNGDRRACKKEILHIGLSSAVQGSIICSLSYDDHRIACTHMRERHWYRLPCMREMAA